MTAPPRKRRLIDLLQSDDETNKGETSAFHGSSSAMASSSKGLSSTADKRDDDDEEEDDFMSDKFLQPSSRSTSPVQQRRHPGLSPPPASNRRSGKERQPWRGAFVEEEEARKKGLAKSLLGPDPKAWLLADEDSADANSKQKEEEIEDSKALKMLKAMGYVPGKALGEENRPSLSLFGELQEMKSPDAEQEEGLQAQASTSKPLSTDPPLASGSSSWTSPNPSSPLSTSHRLLEPIPLDDRRRHRTTARRGIGAIQPLVEQKILSEASRQSKSKQDQQLDSILLDFRSRQSLEAKKRRILSQLREARNICTRLDQEAGVEWSVLWVDEDSWRLYQGERIDLIREEERGILEEAAKDEDAGSADSIAQEDDQDGADAPSTSRSNRHLTLSFLSLSPATRLEITADHLRRQHSYCLGCRTHYSSEDEMERECPGLGQHEDDEED